MNPLFHAHCPQRGYLTKLCDHSYCSILSVAELRRSPDQVVAPFTHSHAAYEFLLPLAPMPIILQGTDVYFGRPGMVYPVQSGVRHGQALEQCDVANISLEVSPNFMVQRLHEKGLDGAQFGPMFAVSERLRRFLRLFQEEFHGRRDEADLRCLAALVISELIECGCRPQPRPGQGPPQRPPGSRPERCVPSAGGCPRYRPFRPAYRNPHQKRAPPGRKRIYRRKPRPRSLPEAGTAQG